MVYIRSLPDGKGEKSKFSHWIKYYKNVVDWVRIYDLPIEYYDARMMTFIGNRIGKMVKVDKNTLMQEHGKYDRLCVEVNLTKLLLAMFTIKGRKYNVD